MACDVGTIPPGIRLLIVEPDSGLCNRLVSSLAKTGNFARIIGSATISEARLAADAGAVDVALVSRETGEAGVGAFHLVQYFLALAKPIRSVMLAEDWNRSEIVEAFRHGAKGLLTGPISDMELLREAVTSVYRGQGWITSDHLNHTLDYFATQASDKTTASNAKDSLSAREQELAQLLARGASNREIADTLHISQRTVKNHLARIFKKMGVVSRTQAALRLLE